MRAEATRHQRTAAPYKRSSPWAAGSWCSSSPCIPTVSRNMEPTKPGPCTTNRGPARSHTVWMLRQAKFPGQKRKRDGNQVGGANNQAKLQREHGSRRCPESTTPHSTHHRKAKSAPCHAGASRARRPHGGWKTAPTASGPHRPEKGERELHEQ